MGNRPSYTSTKSGIQNPSWEINSHTTILEVFCLMEPNCPLFCYSQQLVNELLNLNKSSPYSHMIFPTEPVNITLQSTSRPLSSLPVFLSKFYMFFSTLLLMLCIPYSLSPLVFKCTALPITAMTRFSQPIRTCK